MLWCMKLQISVNGVVEIHFMLKLQVIVHMTWYLKEEKNDKLSQILVMLLSTEILLCGGRKNQQVIVSSFLPPYSHIDKNNPNEKFLFIFADYWHTRVVRLSSKFQSSEVEFYENLWAIRLRCNRKNCFGRRWIPTRKLNWSMCLDLWAWMLKA